ncbi:hypothetical protein QBC36DRAFT_334622 [Triangularia setosa]|uniref:Fungal STAND N-terminal Goodbye domain-containing protein n=1 Tax=Triangularia setosa TaxID=2587417 RepID=A0AAN6W5J2_9PEZI|nr:hypothetical protein QBC36DRAFT_334622 [Podospora setosa]
MASDVTKSKVDRLWQEALVEFRKLTNKDLGEIPKISPDDLRRLIEARAKQNDTEENKKRAKAKDTGLKILACINKLGEVAVQGVSTVFGAADICFKGISLLLDVPKRIREFHEVIDKIFIEIAPVLSQFKIYGRSEQFQAMDEDLLIAIHNVMISLVTICAKAINIEHAGKWQKFKAYASRALCDDEELNEELEKFQMLVKGQQNVQGTVVLETVLETKTNIVTIMKSTNEISSDLKSIKDKVQKKEAENAKQSQVGKIKAALGFKDGKDGDTDNSKTTWDDYLKKRIDGTGGWFKSVEAYNNWAKMETSTSGSSSFLLLTGPPGSGKSFSVASIISDLKEQASTTSVTAQTHRYLTTFYFFPSRSETNPVETALKWIAVQLAELDEAYAKNIGEAESLNPLRYARPAKLWNALKLGAPMSRTTHFIVLDGLDNLPEESLRQLLDIFGNMASTTSVNANQQSVRILASGQPHIFDSIRATESLSWKEIKVDGTVMEPEFRSYIRHKLNAPGMLPGRELKHKREAIEDKIIQGDSNFKTIQNALSVVETCIASGRTDEELDQALEDTAKDANILVKERVEKLEAELDMRQIGWVNELLIWVLFGERQLDVSELETAFIVRGKTVPIQGLENFITSRLKRLITIEPSGRPQLEDGVAKVVTKQREASQTGSESKTISLSIEIKNADISTVQRFLWDIAEFGTLGRFNFNSDDEAAQVAHSRGTVRVNKVDASLAIVNCFFKFLDESDPWGDSRPIAPYLIEDLPKHLRTLRMAEGDDAINDTERGKIGKRLFEILDYPDDLIKLHWNVFQWSPQFVLRSNVEEYWEWIRHDATVNALPGKEKAQVNELRKDDDWTNKLLKPMLKFVAKQWLRERSEDAYWAAQWIIEFLSQQKIDQIKAATSTTESSEAKVPATPATPPPPPPPQVQVAEAASWCIEVLELKESDLNSLWFERLAETYSSRGENAEASSEYQKAVKLCSGDPTWEILTGLCRNLCATGPSNLEEACSLHERAMSLYKDSDVTVDQRVGHLQTIARSKAFQGAPTKALEFFEEAYRLAPDDPNVVFDLMSQLYVLGREAEAQAIFTKTAESKKAAEQTEAGTTEGNPEDLTKLAEVIKAAAGIDFWKRTDVAFWRLVFMATATGRMSDLMRDLEAAHEQVASQERQYMQCMLTLYKGIAHFASHHAGFGNLETAVASCEKARQFARDTTDSYNWWVEQIFEKTTHVYDRYHFNQASGKGRIADSTFQGVESHIRALETSASAFEKSCTGLAPAKGFLAAYYTLKEDSVAARSVFSSDMVRISNMLSDGDASNDTDGLIQLKAVLLFTGDIQNAAVGFRLLPPHIGKIGVKHFKTLLTHLLCPEGVPAEGSIVAELLSWADAEYSKVDDPLYRFGVKLDKILESYYKTRTADGGPDRVVDVTKGDAPPVDRSSAEKGNAVVGIEADDATLKTLEVLRKKMHFNLERTCDSCYCDDIERCWDFERESYACKYCWVDLCETCLDKIKKSDRNQLHPICSPDHDWVRLPKWTLQHWMDTFKNVVRMPKIGENGEIIDGEEVIPVAEWFKGVFGRWGIEHDKDWDINDKEPEEEKEDEKVEANGGEVRVNGEKTDGEEVNGEKLKGEKVTVETVTIEKVTVEKVTAEEVTRQNGSQPVVSA